MRPVISCLRPGRGPGQAINRGTGPSSPAFSCPDPGPAPPTLRASAVGDPGAIHFAAAPEAKTPLALGELLKPPPPQPSGTSGSPKKSQPAAVRARSNRNSPHHTRLGLCIFLPFIRQLATLDFPAVARMVDFAPFCHASHWLALGVLPVYGEEVRSPHSHCHHLRGPPFLFTPSLRLISYHSSRWRNP